MKVAIDRDEFLGLLKTLILAVDTKRLKGTPILTQIKMEGRQERCLFSSNNTEFGVIKTLKANTELPGSCTFPATKMLELIKNFKKGNNVVLTLMEDNRLKVSQGRSRYLINTMNPESFFDVPFFKTDDYSPIDPEAVRDAIKSVYYCISNQEIRPALMGVYFEPGNQEGTIRVVGCDGHRLSCIKIPGVINEPFIVPANTCDALIKILPNTEELGIFSKNGEANFCLDDGVLHSRTIAREYPDYKKIFPSGKHALLVFCKDDMIDVCKRTKLFSGDSFRLNFEVKDKSISITTKDDISEVEEEVVLLDESKFEASFSFAMNANYLLQALEHLKEESISLRIYGGRSPIEIAEKNLTKAILPMV